MDHVYIVYHMYYLDEDKIDDEESKMIGVYTTRKKAKKAMERALKLPGFKEYPDKFIIDRCKLDEDHWKEGFITVYAGKID